MSAPEPTAPPVDTQPVETVPPVTEPVVVQEPADRDDGFIPIEPPSAGECVGVDPLTGIGSTQFTYETCTVAVGLPPVPQHTEAVVAQQPDPADQTLPMTGPAEIALTAVIATFILGLGLGLKRVAHR